MCRVRTLLEPPRDLGVMKPATSQCACYVVTTFTNIYRGSQPYTIASLYACTRLFPFKTDTVFPTRLTTQPAEILAPFAFFVLLTELISESMIREICKLCGSFTFAVRLVTKDYGLHTIDLEDRTMSKISSDRIGFG